MGKIRISAVKYANTYPFIYGLTEEGFSGRIMLETDHPADCATKLINGNVDIGLVPVAIIPLLREHYIISDYCIGANGNVRTVMLLSNSNFNDLDSIYLDYRSRSSVNLTKILAKNSWKKDFRWINTSEGFDFTAISKNEAAVLIGDQCFEYENSFKYKTDLAMEWKKFTGLPFVFACWIANRRIEKGFLEDFNSALRIGVENIDDVVDKFGNTGPIRGSDLKSYLTENIDFHLDDEKRKGMDLFLKLLKII
jgi:chorismate dehydratase